MLNQVILVGRLVSDVEIIETENGEKYSKITLATPRNYKNAEGKYDTDFIDCILRKAIAQNVNDYCKKGDLIGAKGRIETRNVENENGEVKKITEIIAEKVTFLSSRRGEDSNE